MRRGEMFMIVSIDIGTSYSSMCVMGPDGKAKPVDISTGASMYGSKYSLPSAVFVEDNGNVLVGQAAMNSRKRKPQNFCMEFKRNLGQNIPILLGNRSFFPEDLYTELFRHMKSCAEKASSQPIEKAYLTHPASFGKMKKEKILSAAKAAGLFNVELVDEPTAAAMSYCAAGLVKDGQTLLVYDFGGGTFDVSIIKYEGGKFSPLVHPDGVEHCGGIDIDRLIYQDMLSKIDSDMLEQVNKNPLNRMRLETQLAELAIKAKHHLSSATSFEEEIQIGFDMVPYSLKLDRLNSMAAPIISQTIVACRRIVQTAGISISELSSILMVGGTSRVPLVQEMVKQFAGGVDTLSSIDLELAVAKGAIGFYTYVRQVEQKEKDQQSDVEKTERLSQPPCRIQDDKEADKKVAQGYYEQGKRYFEGTGVPQSYEEAMRWYRLAAEKGDIQSEEGIQEIKKLEEQQRKQRKKEEALKPENILRHYRDHADDLILISSKNGGGCKVTTVMPDGTVLSEDEEVLKAGLYDIVSIGGNPWSGIVGIKDNGTAVMITAREGTKDLGWTDVSNISSCFMSGLVAGIRRDGTVVATSFQKELDSWRDIVSLSVGYDFIVGLRKDGTVAATGSNNRGQCNVEGWKDMVSVEAGSNYDFTVGLKKDGRVIFTGSNDNGAFNDVYTWRDIVNIKAGNNHIVGLKADGTVVAAGRNNQGQCEVGKWRDIVSISCGTEHTVGLKKDGTLVATGYNPNGRCDVSEWKDIIAVVTSKLNAASQDVTVGIKKDGTILCTDFRSKMEYHLFGEDKLIITPMPTRTLPWSLF